MRGIKDLVLNVCIFFLFNITEKLNYFPAINKAYSAFILQPISVTDNGGRILLKLSVPCNFHTKILTLTVY
jgi:hypothetical protein